MKSNVFISWSGSYGERVARTLHASLSELFGSLNLDVDMHFSPLSQRVGGDWRADLDRALAACDLGILLLDPRAVHSPWVGYEAGALATGRSARRADLTIFPLFLSDTIDALRDTPYNTIQCACLAPESLALFTAAVLNAVGASVDRVALAASSEQLRVALHAEWDAIRHQELESGKEFRIAACDLIERYLAYSLLSPEDASAYRNLVELSRRPVPVAGSSLLTELGEIARLFRECGAPSRGDFGPLAIEWAIKNLVMDSREQLAEINRGLLPVKNRAPVREFWMNQIFGRARETVWTTNVATPGSNMGGAPDQNLLDAQQRAVQRDVRVTRVFVFDPEMSEEEASARRKVMRHQLEIGIEIRVITEADFRTKSVAENARRRIGSDDFMIVDNKFVYLTMPDDRDDIEATMYDGLMHGARLAAARSFQAVLNSWSDLITPENLDQFPKRIWESPSVQP